MDSGESARREVHRLRSIYDAVIISEATIRADDALLTVRNCQGRNPLRVVLDRQLKVPLTPKIFGSEAETILFASSLCSGLPMVVQFMQI